MTADVRHDSILPPPQPPDKEGTRPPLDLAHVVRQVREIQTFLAGEREREWEKARELLKGAGEEK